MHTLAAVALVSLATLVLEITLLRLFAVQQFYHFAFMAVSLALLGNGASGAWLSLRPRRATPLALCLAFSLAVLAAYLAINTLPFDSFSIAWDGRQALYLAAYFLAAAVPFFFAGLLVGGALIEAGGAGGSHRVYAANLLGSALGSVGALPVLAAFSGEGAVLLAAALGLLAGGILAGPDRRRTRAGLGAGLLICLLLAGLWAAGRPPDWLALRLSPYKSLSILSQALDARHTLTAWDARARIDVVESSTIHSAPGLSLAASVGLPLQAGLLLDGDNLMPINHLGPDEPAAALLADHLPTGLAYRLRPRPQVLVIGAGAGAELLWALASGATAVTAVEENELLLDVVSGPYGDFSYQLWRDPRVTVIRELGRVTVRRTPRPAVDVAVVALTDTHRPVTSGAYSLTENYVYTVNGMADYYAALNDAGLLVVTRWLQTPPSESGRLFGMMVAAVAGSGRDPAAHLLAFRTLRTMTVVAGRAPLSAPEIGVMRRFLQERGFDAVYFPGIRPGDSNRFNVLPAPAYYDLFQAILADPVTTWRNYRYDIRPPTDDHPFFYHYFRWRQAPEILATLGRTWQPFGGSGFFVLVALLILVTLAAVLFILAPLWWQRRAPRRAVAVRWWRARTLAYFACLGLGFLFVELPLAQRFILLLGQPVTALAVVIFAVLLFSGLGSLAARRWPLPWVLAALVGAVALYPPLLTRLETVALAWPAGGRLAATVLALAPLGFLMGIPFAAGLRHVEALDPALVPWVWAINGSFSVISSVLAVMAALTWRLPVVLWLGAAAYAAALASYGRLPPPASPS